MPKIPLRIDQLLGLFSGAVLTLWIVGPLLRQWYGESAWIDLTAGAAGAGLGLAGAELVMRLRATVKKVDRSGK